MIHQNKSAHNDITSCTSLSQKLKGAAKLGARGVGVCLSSVKYIGQCTAFVTAGLLTKVVGAAGQSSNARCFDVTSPSPLCTCSAAPPYFYDFLPKPGEAPDSETGISWIALGSSLAAFALGCTIVVTAVCIRVKKYNREARQGLAPAALPMSHVDQQSKLLQSGDADDVSHTLPQSPAVERD